MIGGTRGGRSAQRVVALACVLAFGLPLARPAFAQPSGVAGGAADPGTGTPPAAADIAPPAVPGLVPVPASPAVEWEPRGAAELQALDKIDDRAAILNVPVGQTAQFERLSVTVRACLARPADHAPDAAGFLQILDRPSGPPAFSGWMLAAEPYVSMLQSRSYDVRVLGCR